MKRLPVEAINLSQEEFERRKKIVREEWGHDPEWVLREGWLELGPNGATATMFTVWSMARRFLLGRQCRHGYYYFQSDCSVCGPTGRGEG